MVDRREFVSLVMGTSMATVAGCAAAKGGGKAPLLKIAVMSDIQGYARSEDAGMRNLERALDVFAPLRPDVVVNAGDINDHGRDMEGVRYYKRRCDERLGVLPHVGCAGNHEIGFIPKELRAERTSAVCVAEFNAVFGEGSSTLIAKTIGGYDFIALSLSDIAGYSTADMALLKKALERAVARDAKKPIFVVTHYHPLNTVNSSASVRQDGGLRNLLNNYPQVINLSGHTHNPLQDPRSIWQGEFTAIETSTLCYGCIEMKPIAANQISCLVPFGHESVGCMLLEVYSDCLIARRFSVRDRREIDPERPWKISLPYDPAKAVYSFGRRAASEAVPDFDYDAEPTIWYDYGYVYLMFTAVQPLGSVFGYRIELTKVDDGATKSYFHLSDYYRNPRYQQERIVFRMPPNAVQAGEDYRCRISPVGFFGREGRPLEWTFSVRDGYPCRKDLPNMLPE